MRHSILRHILRGAAALLIAAAVLVPALAVGARSASAASSVPVSGRSSFDAVAAEAEAFRAELALNQEDVKAAPDEGEYFPHLWPVRFSEGGYVSSEFGSRLDPVTEEKTEFHAGVDLADKPNSKIYAAAAGTVTEAMEYGSFGLTILIDHGNGYETRYSHCSNLLVSEGDTVVQGQIIATMGATGRATGVHCDFRVYLDGTAIDPMTVLDPPGQG